jgi:1,4-alpha-glucan branching enzyme
MTPLSVRFRYYTGLTRNPFRAASLLGSWTADGLVSRDGWHSSPMGPFVGEDGCRGFAADLTFDPAGAGSSFAWGVLLTRADGSTVWGVAAEVPEADRAAQELRFTLKPAGSARQVVSHHFSHQQWYGAHPRSSAGSATGELRFAVWAPNAADCRVIFGGPSGYIADDGYGVDATLPHLPMTRDPDGVWEVITSDPDRLVGRRYMYLVTRDDGQPQWCTDMHSREQCGCGDIDPQGRHYDGDVAALDGTPSCSVVVDTTVVADYPPVAGATPRPDAEFWADEYDADRPVPRRVADLVIYELHLGALAPATTAAGTVADAIALLPYLSDLGINAVELLPMFEFNGSRSWGYGSSHFLAIETSAGGRDALKHFVKECHRRGIAVLMDVVYNHYNDDSARAAWQYDSLVPSRNDYLWYEGQERHYADPTGGYLDNVSSGWAPRYWDAHVRALFVSSATMLVDEFHIDGLRVDQTTSIHAYNSLHADGRAVPAANIAGRKFLRELCQTIKAAWPDAILIAEDHSGWPPVTQPAETGGIGFDASWYSDFYHHLIGDKDEGPQYARLLETAGADQAGPLAMSLFSTALASSGGQKVVYVESHDEAGNAEHSLRTILVAVHDAPLVGDTRRSAEARCRFAAGMSFLSAGTPMFLMGEEVGAQRPYTYNRFYEEKEDLLELRATTGAALFRYYSDIIRFRLAHAEIRSRNLEVIAANDAGRVIAFRRWDETADVLIVASLANVPYDNYHLSHPSLRDDGWRERFNSDSHDYGGDDVGNGGATLRAAGGTVDLVLPANGFVILERVLTPSS